MYVLKKLTRLFLFEELISNDDKRYKNSIKLHHILMVQVFGNIND